MPPAQPLITPARRREGRRAEGSVRCAVFGAAAAVHVPGGCLRQPARPAPGYDAPNGWTVYDSAGRADLDVGAGWTGLLGEGQCKAVTLYNFGIYPPRPGDLPQVYEAGQNWNLMGYTDA